MKKYQLINSDIERAKYKKLDVIQIGDLGRDFLEIYESDEHLIFYSLSKGDIDDTESQTELPIESIFWIKDTIVNGFWKKPSQGGLPKTEHSVENTIKEENILLGRSMNAGDYNKKGFKIVNKSRSSYILSFRPQELQISDELLASKIFQIFDKYKSY